MLDWIYDPTVWAGLGTLVLLEIVLGIDNLIFIAILSDKLAPHERRKARFIGLSLALVMRLFLLTALSWMTQLTDPLFHVLTHAVSGRDLIMLVGGAFLIFKATMELHEKLEGGQHHKDGPVNYAKFWQVVAQIVVLDAVFSLDAVITAVGMADHVSVMMLAVLIAMGIMILASNALMNFVSAHPTVVILCLGFLLMIGFSLVVEGFGYHVPKGYLYAAIGFSVLIEALNQTALHKSRKAERGMDMRERTMRAVLKILGGARNGVEVPGSASEQQPERVFGEQERQMIQRVLQIAEQSVQAIMTPRRDLFWIDLNDDTAALHKDLRECPYAYMVVARDGQIEEPLGIIHKKDLANLLLDGKLDQIKSIVRQPLITPDSVTVLQLLEAFRESRIHLAFVVDEYGALEGMITITDITEAIAGDMPEAHEGEEFHYERFEDGSVAVNGALSIEELENTIKGLNTPEGDYHTVAGMVLDILKRLPRAGDHFDLSGWRISVEEMEKRRIKRVRFTPQQLNQQGE